MIQGHRQAQQQRMRQRTFPTQGYDYQEPIQQSQKKPNYDEEFNIIYQQIIQHQYFSKITKHEKIRINKWLTKLSNISTNNLWKKNRNNYIKLIRLMFDCQLIIAPFLMMPPERDLHKLTPHQINVIIDQLDKLIDERQTKNNSNANKNQQKVNKVHWTQESAYIDHQNSYDKSKDIQTDCKRTNHSSSVTANFSKLSQIHYPIPPKHPSTTKNNKSTQKNINYLTKGQQLDKNKKYFQKKQRFETFQTEQISQQEYLIMMKNSAMENNSPIVEKDTFQIKDQQKDAINILKCGFKLLQKIPLSSLQPSAIHEIQTFRKILSQSELLKNEFEKENLFLDQLANRCPNNNTKTLQQSNSLDYRRKSKVTQRKKKLTLTSQSTTRR